MTAQQQLDFAALPPPRAAKPAPGFELHEPRRCERCRAVTFAASRPCFICTHFPKLAEPSP